MKIALAVFDMSLYGGAERVAVNLANELSGKMEVHVISLCATSCAPAFTLNEKVQYRELGLKKQRIRQMIKASKPVLAPFFAQQQYDVILAEAQFAGLLLMQLRFNRKVKSKLIFCDHGSLMSQWDSKGKTLGRFLMALCYHKTVVVTEQSKSDYIRRFHLPERKVECIYNWMEDELLAQTNCYNSKSKQILSVGRFGKEKGYDMLVQVARQCMPEHPDWQWHIYGDGETFEQIQQSLQELQLDQQVILKGAVQDILSRYKDYAFLVLPSYREGLPLALLEAQAAHLPLISFDVITGPAEIVVDGVNGYLIPPYDIEGMATKISQLMESEDTRQSFSDHAYDKINRFSKQVILEKWKQLLEG